MMPMLTAIFTLPEGTAGTIGSNASQVLTDLFPVWGLVAGVLLGTLVVMFVINAMHRK